MSFSCHIDTAHLWPYRVTQQKVARSWSTQVDLMDRYPELRFTCSSAQQYKWLEEVFLVIETLETLTSDGKLVAVPNTFRTCKGKSS
jgi:alpha-mannosidase